MGARTGDDLLEVVGGVTAALVGSYDLLDLLHDITARAASTLGTAAGLLLAAGPGRLHLVAASDERAAMLELLQGRARSGPCYDVVRDGRVIDGASLVPGETTWPHLAAPAEAVGCRVVHAFPLRSADGIAGGLNVFGGTVRPLEPEQRMVGQALADLAMLALMQDTQPRRAQVLASRLASASEGRVAVEQAKGYLAEVRGLTIEEAGDALRAYAATHGLPVSRVATSLIADPGTLPGLARS